MTPDARSGGAAHYIRGGTIRYRRMDRTAERAPPAVDRHDAVRRGRRG